MRQRHLTDTSLVALLGATGWAASANAAPIYSKITPGTETFSVPAAGTYQILAIGTGSGSSTIANGKQSAGGGRGASIEGTFVLPGSEILSITVGGQGGNRRGA